MYTITLTADDRRAVDWVGNRYSHGDNLRRILCRQVATDEWDSAGDVTYNVPEHIAWQVAEIIREDSLACFADDLSRKLWTFADRIV